MTEDKMYEFELLSKQLIKWLCENGHPHMTIITSQTHSELLEGVQVISTEEFLID